jgi:hypothetical protein
VEPPLLPRFFERVTQQVWSDLALDDQPAARYVTELLTRFARTDALYRATVLPGRRLETVVEALGEVQRAWDIDSPGFAPEREQALRRHIGDFTLFMTGIFRDHVQRLDVAGLYEAEGRRAYRFVSETARAQGAPDAPLYRRLSERFEHYSGALCYMRKVYFQDRAPRTAPPDDGLFRRLVTPAP